MRCTFWILIVAVCLFVLAGCQIGGHASMYYPEDGWKSGGDPADSRLSSQGINPRGFDGMRGGK